MKEDQRLYEDRIVTDPRILAGTPIVKGTRIAVNLVLEELSHNPNIEALLATHPNLTVADAQACLAYAKDLVTGDARPLKPLKARRADAVLNSRHVDVSDTILSLGLYSYACFTTFAVDNGRVRGFTYHIDRLLGDSRELFGISPHKVDIIDNITTFLTLQSTPAHVIVRITLFPAGFSLKAPEYVDFLNILVTGRSHDSAGDKPMRLSIVDTSRALPLQKTTNMISLLKARAIAHNRGFDDALLVNGTLIMEGTTWNIFLAQKRG